jgi:small nuclear ribonucleoprotein (snRNP)-like protein
MKNKNLLARDYVFDILRYHYHRQNKAVRPQTINVYTNKILRLSKLLKNDIIFITPYLDTKYIINFLENNFKNINSRNLYLSTILIWLQSHQCPEGILSKYREYLFTISKKNKNIQKNKMSKELDFTLRDVYNIREEYETKINHIDFEHVRHKDKKLLQDYLLFLFYSGLYTPPPRNNLWNLIVLQFVNEKIICKHFNYICTDTKEIIYTDFKTKKSHGVVRVPIPDEFFKIIMKYEKYISINNFLFKNLDSGSTYHKQSFLLKIKRVFNGKATINTLRHLYLTRRYSELKDILRRLKHDTEGMMSSPGTALKFYIHSVMDELEIK